MVKAYVIIMGSGEYSSRETEPVRVYLSSEKAKKIMGKLESIERKYNDLCHQEHAKGAPQRAMGITRYFSHELAGKLNPEITKEYAKLGFDASIYDDWKLAEAEFDDTYQ